MAKRSNFDYATVINKALDTRNILSLGAYEQVDIFNLKQLILNQKLNLP